MHIAGIVGQVGKGDGSEIIVSIIVVEDSCCTGGYPCAKAEGVGMTDVFVRVLSY